MMQDSFSDDLHECSATRTRMRPVSAWAVTATEAGEAQRLEVEVEEHLECGCGCRIKPEVRGAASFDDALIRWFERLTRPHPGFEPQTTRAS